MAKAKLTTFSAVLPLLLAISFSAQISASLLPKGSYEPTKPTTTSTPAGPIDGGDEVTDPAPIVSPPIDDLNSAAEYEMNVRRKHHGTRPLTYKPELQELAANAAAFYAKDEVAKGLKPIQTASGFDCQNVKKFTDLPENIGVQFAVVGTTSIPEIAMDKTVDRWYQRKNADDAHFIPAYPYTNVPFDRNLLMYGPFTQLIWDSTTAFACSMTSVDNPDNKIRMIACCFEPAGNVVIDGSADLYEKNVPKP